MDIAEPKRLGTKCQTQAVKIAWAAAADGLEANDADGDNCKRRASRPCLHGHDRASAVGHEVPAFRIHDGSRLIDWNVIPALSRDLLANLKNLSPESKIPEMFFLYS